MPTLLELAERRYGERKSLYQLAQERYGDEEEEELAPPKTARQKQAEENVVRLRQETGIAKAKAEIEPGLWGKTIYPTAGTIYQKGVRPMLGEAKQLLTGKEMTEEEFAPTLFSDYPGAEVPEPDASSTWGEREAPTLPWLVPGGAQVMLPLAAASSIRRKMEAAAEEAKAAGHGQGGQVLAGASELLPATADTAGEFAKGIYEILANAKEQPITAATIAAIPLAGLGKAALGKLKLADIVGEMPPEAPPSLLGREPSGPVLAEIRATAKGTPWEGLEQGPPRPAPTEALATALTELESQPQFLEMIRKYKAPPPPRPAPWEKGFRGPGKIPKTVRLKGVEEPVSVEPITVEPELEAPRMPQEPRPAPEPTITPTPPEIETPTGLPVGEQLKALLDFLETPKAKPKKLAKGVVDLPDPMREQLEAFRGRLVEEGRPGKRIWTEDDRIIGEPSTYEVHGIPQKVQLLVIDKVLEGKPLTAATHQEAWKRIQKHIEQGGGPRTEAAQTEFEAALDKVAQYWKEQEGPPMKEPPAPTKPPKPLEPEPVPTGDKLFGEEMEPEFALGQERAGSADAQRIVDQARQVYGKGARDALTRQLEALKADPAAEMPMMQATKEALDLLQPISSEKVAARAAIMAKNAEQGTGPGRGHASLVTQLRRLEKDPLADSETLAATKQAIDILERQSRGVPTAPPFGQGGLAAPVDLFRSPEPTVGPKYPAEGNINLWRLDADPEFTGIVARISEHHRGWKTQARRPTSWKESNAAAQQLIEDGVITPETAAKMRPGTALNASEVTALRNLNMSTLTDFVDAGRRAAELRATGRIAEADVVQAQMGFLYDRAVAVMKAREGASAEAGRALNIHRQQAQTIEQVGWKRWQQNLKDQGITPKLAELEAAATVLDSKNPTQINRFLRDTQKVTRADKFWEVAINGMFTAGTQVRNALGNATGTLLKLPDFISSAGVEAVKARLEHRPRERFVREAVHAATSLGEGMREGFRRAKFFWKEEFPAQGASQIISEGYKPVAVQGKLGRAVRLQTRTAATMDQFWKPIAGTAHRYAEAYRQARIEGRKGKALTERQSDLIANPTDEMIASQSREELYRTYNDTMTPVGSKVAQLRNIKGWGHIFRAIMPFVRIGERIAVFVAKRDPAIGLGRIVYKAAKGQLKGAGGSDVIGEYMTGLAFASVVAWEATKGRITGKGPSDPNKRAMLMATGWKPHSLRIGDKWVSYANLEPFSSMVAMPADFVDLWRYRDMNREEESNWLREIVGVYGRNLMDKTYASGMRNFMLWLTDDEEAQNPITGFTSSVVPAGPWSGLTASVGRALDPLRRETQGAWYGKAMERTPVLRTLLPEKLDIWGKPIQYTEGPLSSLAGMQIQSAVEDPLGKELWRLQIPIGKTSRTLKGQRLSVSDYRELQKTLGPKLYESLSRFITLPGYTGASPEQQRAMIDKWLAQIRAQVRQQFTPTMEMTQ